MEIITTVDDEMYENLVELIEQPVVYTEVWEDSVTDALDKKPASPELQTIFDIDLYLGAGVFFELYGVSCYSSLEADPWQGSETVQQQLQRLQAQRLIVADIAVNEQDALVLIFTTANAHNHEPVLYLDVGGWILEEWDELPE